MQDKTVSENAIRQRKFRLRKLAEKLAEKNRVDKLIATFKTEGVDKAKTLLKSIKGSMRYIEVDPDGDIHVNLQADGAREYFIKNIEYLLISLKKAEAKNDKMLLEKQKDRLNSSLERQKRQSQIVIQDCKRIDGEMKKLNAVLNLFSKPQTE